MTENVRKRISKWDIMAETHVSTEIGHENVQPGKAVDTCDDKSNLDWNSSKSADGQCSKRPDMEVNNIAVPKDFSESYQYSKWSDLKADDAALSKDCTERSHISKWSDLKADIKDCPNRSNWEPASGIRDDQKDGNANRESGELGVPCGWSYSKSISPGLDTRQQQSRSISPKSGWSRSYRSRSRSRDRSPSGNRSPFHGFRREGEGLDDRRMGTGVSRAPCRDFIAGRCRRGSQCRYHHVDGGRRHSDRHYDSNRAEIRESRYERGRSSGHDSKEHFVDSVEQRDYSRGKLSHGYANQYDGGWEKPEPHKHSRSTFPCHNFMRGRCQRGSTCKYVHHNASSDGEWHVKERTRDSTHERGDTDASFGPDQRSESRRVSNISCKYFSEGRCRNGEKCRFTHQDLVESHPEGRLHDDNWVRNSGGEGILAWDGPKCGDQLSSVAVPNASEWPRDDNGTEESGHDLQDMQLQYYSEEDIKHNILPKEAPQTGLPVQDQNASQEISGKQHQYVSTGDMLPRENESLLVSTSSSQNEINMLPREDESIVVNSSRSQNEMNFYANNLPNIPAMPGQSFNQCAQSQYIISQPPNAQSFNPVGQSQQVVTAAPFDGQRQQQVANSLPLNAQNQFVVPQTPSNVQSFNCSGHSQQIPHPFTFNGQSQQSNHSLPQNGQSQFITPQPLQNLISFNIEKQNQQIPSQPPTADHQTQISQEEPLQKTDAVETKALQISSEIPITQRVVSSEQVAQLTNLSASLAQIFGNGQQLPQLYAALNPLNAVGVVPSNPFSHPSSVRPLESAAVPYIQPNQGSWSQQQFEPKSDNTELVEADISKLPPGFSSNSVEQKNTTIKESQTPLKTLAPSSATDGLNSGNPFKSVDSQDNQVSKQVDMNGDESKELNETATGQSKKEQQTAHSEDVEADVRTDGESKRSKDVKGIRLFKFALVEFVKDILKPTWKEGHMSKEAHKTIVKKVVDKVTGTLEPNIPQTQERIDLYLSYSKPKLGKLVQAYVEKYLKT